MVMEQTGHDKVIISPISQGGSLANALFEYHPDIMDHLAKVLYIVPCLDGSTIIGDVFNDRVRFLDPNVLYDGFLSTFFDVETASMLEVILRILPDEVVIAGLEKGVEVLVNDVMTKSTSMWAMCPSRDYLTAAEKYLSDPERAAIKEQTDKYYQAQLNSHKNIQALVDKGVEVFDIVDYDIPLYLIGNSWNDDNADGVIQLSSTAMGVHSALVGETLGADYQQANTSINCADPSHNHISPDNVVDASTGLLPDHTFYFDAQGHEQTARNDAIIALATRLLATDDIKDVYSTPDFPQFNAKRDPRALVNTYIPQAKAVDASTLSAEDAAELAAAIAQAEAFVNNTASYDGQQKEVEDRLVGILVKIGVREASVKEEPGTFFTNLSLWLYDNYGTDGIFEISGAAFKTFAKVVKDIMF